MFWEDLGVIKSRRAVNVLWLPRISKAKKLYEGTTPFRGLLHFNLDTYLIMLSVKQGSIKYHF